MNQLIGASTTSLVATILLSENRNEMRGMRMEEIAQRVAWLKDEIIDRNGTVSEVFYQSDSSIIQIVDSTLSVLGSSLVQIKEGGLVMITHYSSVLELSMYRNQICHWFVQEAIVAVAVLTLLHWKSQSDGSGIISSQWNRIHTLIKQKIKVWLFFYARKFIFKCYTIFVSLVLARFDANYVRVVCGVFFTRSFELIA